MSEYRVPCNHGIEEKFCLCDNFGPTESYVGVTALTGIDLHLGPVGMVGTQPTSDHIFCLFFGRPTTKMVTTSLQL
jgi:hypothetical protein